MQLTIAQLNIVTRYAVECGMDEGSNVESMLRNLRSRFNIASNEPDLMIADAVMQEVKRSEGTLPLTAPQQRMVDDLIACLSGEHPHWNREIDAKIMTSSDDVRLPILEEFKRVRTQRDLNTVMMKFTAVYGTPSRRSDDW